MPHNVYIFDNNIPSYSPQWSRLHFRNIFMKVFRLEAINNEKHTSLHTHFHMHIILFDLNPSRAVFVCRISRQTPSLTHVSEWLHDSAQTTKFSWRLMQRLRRIMPGLTQPLEISERSRKGESMLTRQMPDSRSASSIKYTRSSSDWFHRTWVVSFE